ncbi:MAG: ATP-binding protein [Betaproteobacteria bacterium]|nr:ATP-binding protein [Betaproteobacteria bacterium]
MSAIAPPVLLSRLVVLRRVELLTQGAVLLLALGWLRIPLDLTPLLGAMFLLATGNLLTRWRATQQWPITDGEILLHLLFDTLILTVLLFHTGGSANPFVSLLLIPLTLAAAALPALHAWALAVFCAAAYTALLFWNLPLPPPQTDMSWLDEILARASGIASGHSEHLVGFSLHLLGMWLNFICSAALIVTFLTRMAATLREREHELAAAREATLRNEQILALGTLAAGAAHKLGTPLSTLAVALRELELEYPGDTALCEELVLMQTQVAVCKEILSSTLAAAGQPHARDARTLPLDAYLEELLEDWRLIRPGVAVRSRFDSAPGTAIPEVSPGRMFGQALLNLLDNAANANKIGKGALDPLDPLAHHSEHPLEFNVHHDAIRVVIDILDNGPGIAPETAARLGRAPMDRGEWTGTAENPGSGRLGGLGLGIGFFLTNATVEHLGGTVEIFDRAAGPSGIGHGARTRVTLPLARLKEENGIS